MKQALRPYPQYTLIDTYGGQGDHSGHSTYHSGMIRFEKRYGAGLTIQASYVFSKLLTNADSYWGNAIGGNRITPAAAGAAAWLRINITAASRNQSASSTLLTTSKPDSSTTFHLERAGSI